MIKFFHNIRYYVMSNSNSMRPKFPSQSIPITMTDKVQTPEWSLSESVTSLDWIFHVPGDSVQREVVRHCLHATCKQFKILLDSVLLYPE